MRKLFIISFIQFFGVSSIYAGPKEQFVTRTLTQKWYEEPTFWIIVGAIGLCVLVYNIVKDKK